MILHNGVNKNKQNKTFHKGIGAGSITELDTFCNRSDYGSTHGPSYFKTYSTIPPHMTLFE